MATEEARMKQGDGKVQGPQKLVYTCTKTHLQKEMQCTCEMTMTSNRE